MQKTIMCLANSRKPPSGRCIAGKEWGGVHAGQWIRPVSSRESKEVSEEERRYITGGKAQLLDIIQVSMKNQSPVAHQTENFIFDDGFYWAKVGTATWAQVISQQDQYDANFWVQAESTYHGLNDKVADSISGNIRSSLKLIAPSNLKLEVVNEEGYEGRPSRRRLRARFEYHQTSYNLLVTDPEVEDQYLAMAEGCYPINTAILCISLTESWHGSASRLVASVIAPERCVG